MDVDGDYDERPQRAGQSARQDERQDKKIGKPKEQVKEGGDTCPGASVSRNKPFWEELRKGTDISNTWFNLVGHLFGSYGPFFHGPHSMKKRSTYGSYAQI